LEERRRRNREAARAARRDPEKAARIAASKQRSVARVKADRERHAEMLDKRRIDYRLAAERERGAMAVASGKRRRPTGALYPIGPFRGWILGLVEEGRLSGVPSPYKYAAARMGVSERRLQDYLKVWVTVAETIVDFACSTDGRIMFTELYPPDGSWVVLDESASVIPKRSVGPEARCISPGCRELRNGNGRFCHEHFEVLSRVREELDADGRLMSANGAAPKRSTRPRRTDPAPTCCSPHCWSPREVGHRFCSDCEDAGLVEEEMFV
jgi:hypothetical protein